MGNIEKEVGSGPDDIATRFAAVTRDLYNLAAQGKITPDIQCIPVPAAEGATPNAFLLQFGEVGISVGADGSMFFVNGEGAGQQFFSVAADINNLVMASDIIQRSSQQEGN
jgi:hypothetical protein